MKKRILAVILVICLCAALLPTVAMAEGPVEGLYAAIDGSNMPVGNPIPQESIDDGLGYIVEYDDTSAKTVYYYRQGVKDYTCSVGNGLTYEIIGDNIMAITVEAGSGTVVSFFEMINSSGGPHFPIVFEDTSIDVGLYYKKLSVIEGPGIDDPSVSLGGGVYSHAPLDMKPYVDRENIAVYFYDGAEFKPVSVTASKGLSVDLFDVSQHPDRYSGAEDKTGWYMIMAYDFTAGHLEYRHTDGHTYKLQLNANRLPGYAFYAHDAASHGHYRMYQVMDPNTDTTEGYTKEDYKYRTTLYLKSSDSSFNGFDADDIVVTCGQQLYDEAGYMINDPVTGKDLKPVTQGVDYDYKAETLDNGNGIEFTIYSNISDLFFRAEKDTQNWDEWYGAYVNLLTGAEDSPLMLNLGNQTGFASASFLPAHLFKQAKAAGLKVTLQKPGFNGTVTCDEALSADISDNIALEGGVSVDMSVVDTSTRDSYDEAIDTAAGRNATVIEVLDLNLYYSGESQHDFVGESEAVVSYNCSVPNGTTVRVYYIDKDGNVTDEYFDAIYEGGTLTFPTSHFSKFAIAALDPIPVYYPPVVPAEPVKPEVEPPFTDVAAGSYYEDAVKWAYNNDVTTGATDTTFAPKAECQRAQVITFLWRAAGSPAPVGTGADLSDVASGTYYEKAVKWAIEKGITNGLGADTFGVSTDVTRAQFVTFLWRYAGCPKPLGTKDFSDVTDGAYYSDAVIWAAENGITDGVGGNKFAPGETCTRAQIVTFLYRYFG